MSAKLNDGFWEPLWELVVLADPPWALTTMTEPAGWGRRLECRAPSTIDL